MELKKQKNRVFLFDNLKFLLIVLVVVGHFVDGVKGGSHLYKSIFIFIYSFHMPLFLFCSGVFHKNKDVFIRALRYICTGFALKIIFTVMKLLLHGEPSFELLSDGGLPWYMFVLAIYVGITYAFRNVDKRFLLVFSVILACFVGYDDTVGDFLYLSRTIVFYPFYLCGSMISKDTLVKINSKKLLKVFSLCVIAAWIVFCFVKTDSATLLRGLFTGRNPFATKEIFEKWGFLYRLLTYLITTITSFAVFCLVPSCKIPVITNCGSKTLQVYLWHWPGFMVLQKIGLDA